MKRDDKIMAKKRKRHDHSENQTGFSGVASFAERPQSSSPPSESKQDNRSDGGQWQTVTPKKRKGNLPELRYNLLHAQQRAVKIGDLQSLVLYCLADAPAPEWIAVRYHHEVRKAVILLVPGLEKSMFDRSVPLSEPLTQHSVHDSQKAASFANPFAGKENDAGHAFVTNNAQSNRFRSFKPSSPDDYLPFKLNPSSMPDQLKPLAGIFEYVWPVRAPGDDRLSQVHSPLHAMLQSPIPKPRAEKETERGMKGARPQHGTAHWENQETSIVHFLATAEQLLENGFVLHPSSWQSAGLDSVREQMRRQAEKQTKEHGWQNTDVFRAVTAIPKEEDTSNSSLNGNRQVLAIDCEMCTVQGGKSALTRISILDWNGDEILDELVKPSLPIIDYLTLYSGITASQMEPVTTTLSDIQTRILDLITPSTILIGHSLESDLTAIQMTHPHIVDTSILYPHPRGPPMKSSLKWLSQKYLNRDIQKGHGTTGHSSIEDALAVLDLVKLKCKRGPRWGTPEANSEPIFKRIKRSSDQANVRRGCIIDWGDPGGPASFGKMAEYTISCENDDEVVTAVSRAVNGDKDGLHIPGGGVAVTWARLRELEHLRGWRDHPLSNREERNQDNNNHDPEANHTTTATPPQAGEATNSIPPTTSPTLGTALTTTISHITQIHASLPKSTLLIIYSGTGDPRAMKILNERKRRFQKLFHSGVKWDEIPTEERWTDTQEQELRFAVARAREGVAFVTIT